MKQHHHFVADKKFTDKIIVSKGFKSIGSKRASDGYYIPKGKERTFFENFRSKTGLSEGQHLFLNCEQLSWYGYGDCTGLADV